MAVTLPFVLAWRSPWLHISNIGQGNILYWRFFYENCFLYIISCFSTGRSWIGRKLPLLKKKSKIDFLVKHNLFDWNSCNITLYLLDLIGYWPKFSIFHDAKVPLIRQVVRKPLNILYLVIKFLFTCAERSKKKHN